MASTEEKNKFFAHIEELVQEKELTYLEAVKHYMDEIGLEIEVAVSLMNMKLKEKLEEEAQGLNLIKKSGSKLPL